MSLIKECGAKDFDKLSQCKLGASYKKGRRLQEVTDVELSRSKIVFLSLDGKPQRISLVINH